MKFARGLFCALLPAAIGMSLPVAAQEAQEAQEEEGAAAEVIVLWEEIVVAARRREDSLQEVPLSVSALTAEQLKRRGLRDLQDISQNASGLIYENYATAGLSTAAVIRGLGQVFTTARVQNTAVFMDGIYLQRQSMINPGLMDMERVEVIKGPQNAQFGRNAFSGVINYITQQPGETPSGEAGLTYGNGGRIDLRASLSGPLVEGLMYGRVAAGRSEFDGHTDNEHPYADEIPPGRRATNKLLGGWNDRYYSASLRLTPTDRFEIGASFYRSESVREPQAFYNLNGARYAYDTAEFGGPPSFAFTAPIAANCLNTVTFSDRAPFPARGFHAYCGKFPSSPPVLDDPALAAAGFGYAQEDMVVDPRSMALDSETSIAQLNLSYDLSESTSLSYRFGYVDHEAGSYGTAEGRASLIGSRVAYAPVQETPFPPFLQQLGPPGSMGALAQASTFNANPAEALEATSHELRLSWTGERVSARAGLYRSRNEDEDGGTFHFVPPCNSPANCRVSPLDASSPLAGRYLAVVPVVPGRVHIGVPHVYDTGHGALGNNATYDDKITAVFGDLEWDISDALTLALEARYTKEKKAFEQLTTTFGAALPDNVDASREETFNFFTPRVILEWRPAPGSMLYGLVAKGVKTGGFNVVDPSQNPEQAVFDEEENITYELGSKNRLFDDRLTLNAAFYFIDWQGVQGSEAATSADAWTRDVVGNIGDAEVIGLELDGVLRATDQVFFDYSLTLSNAEYKDAIYLSSQAGRDSSWGCNDTVCRADGRVDGNQVERTANTQYSLGLNYAGRLFGDWDIGARIGFNYRSRMYATPLNLAHNGGRTLSNAHLYLGNDNWSFRLWGRNIFDKQYVANSFVLHSFNRYIVGLGARRTVGLTLEYAL